MDGTNKQEQREWLREQIKKYKRMLPKYRKYTRVLREVLEKAIRKNAPLAIVQTRPKSIASFGEKALRKKHANRYRDAVNQMTDLCGGRVIVPTLAEVKTISEFIEEHFEIDWENTVDVSNRLKPAEFGYRGIHYIVEFKPGIFPTKEIDVEIPEELFGLRAEIQVKTILEHAWQVFNHDRAYKGAFKIPEKWEREMAALAAILEDADSSFASIETGLQRYAASYGTYMTEEQIRDEIENLKIILAHDTSNTALAARIGKLAIALDDWQVVINLLSKYVDSGYQPILRDLGVAMCKLYRDNPNSEEYRQGQEYLEAASTLPYKDSDALASLAGTQKGIDEDKARELYRQAFEVDPSDPYPLGNYLEYEITRMRDVSVVPLLHPIIDNAIQRCRDQADVGMNLPWAFYDMGKFYLLMEMPYESLTAYAKAIQLSTASWMIDTSLKSLEKLGIVRDTLPGYEWVRRLLLIALDVKLPEDEVVKEAMKQAKKLASTKHNIIPGPVIIVAGGFDLSVEQQMQDYHQLILEAFRDFKGTVISGGTTAGVGSLVAEIGSRYPDTIRTIGYIPRKLPAGVKKDSRYSDVHRTEGDDFSPLEALQYWIDIIASGIPSSQVKLLGINGGTISAAEYTMALSLGAQVAVLKGSGGRAAKLITDDDWANSKALLHLPVDAITIGAFVGGARPPLEPEFREIIAQAIHEDYRKSKTRSSRTGDLTMVSWEKLPENLKESNLQQTDDIYNKLRRIGCTVFRPVGRKVAKMTFTKDEIEVMAEMEHARWNVERLLDGWKWGEERDVVKKVSPYLVPWAELPENEKKRDRETVREIPEFLAKVGLEVRRQV